MKALRFGVSGLIKFGDHLGFVHTHGGPFGTAKLHHADRRIAGLWLARTEEMDPYSSPYVVIPMFFSIPSKP